MKRIPLNAVKDGLWRYLREAEKEEVIEEDPRLLKRIAQALEAAAAGRWDTAVLLAVQAGIPAVDSACVAGRGVRSISPTHMDHVRLIRQLFPRDDEARKASNHLAALLDRKNTVEYEGRLCRAHDAETATKHAERLVAWARTI